MNYILFQQLAIHFDGAVFLTAYHADDNMATLAVAKSNSPAFKAIIPIKKMVFRSLKLKKAS
ncbi:hypothetical protein A1OO_01965 [Enterovibrio norvegicus FF-33]|uniref:Uncharacterized protein n=1 Tax=Enterovibrio norvegicus FF-454 TaxID=1185651 RepID=A0A1E5BXA9_9GAMM|nr:hypothetical protein [Enterovibrio norvegicus]OEE57924.1 hypothetical protein A1OK_04640 [Enterovibrio norvegicus FF-454]OEE70563.1 hypothetical protein A1OO_01965 [Enterovibrio norvegicus FF-33]OEE81436.1 hypothetical protein A1OQ_20810 [Enterovibrio norvegicus FF-162]